MSTRREIIAHLKRVQQLTSSNRNTKPKRKTKTEKSRKKSLNNTNEFYNRRTSHDHDFPQYEYDQYRQNKYSLRNRFERDDSDLDFFFSLFSKEKQYKNLIGKLKTHIYFIHWCHRYERLVMNRKHSKHYFNPNIASYVDQFPSTYVTPTSNLSTSKKSSSIILPPSEKISDVVKRVSLAHKRAALEKESQIRKDKRPNTKTELTSSRSNNTSALSSLNYSNSNQIEKVDVSSISKKSENSSKSNKLDVMSDSSDEVDELVKYASELLSKRNDSMSTSSKTNSPKQKKKKNSLSKKTSQTANTSNSIKNPLTMSPAFELHTKKTIIPKQKTEPRKFTVEQTNSIDLITNINSKKPSHPIFDLSTSNDPFSFDLPPKSNLKKTNDTQQKPLKCGIDKPQQSVVSIRPSTEFPNKQPTNVISYDLTISPVDKQNKKLPNSTTEINMSLGFDENNSDQFQIQSNKKIIQKDYSTSDSSQDNKKKRIIFNIDSESNKENNEREEEEDFIDFDLSKLKLPNKKKNDSEKQTRDNTHKRFGQNLQNSLSLSKRESVSHHEDEDANDSNQDIEADFNFAIPKKTDSTIMKNPILNHNYNQDLNIEEEEEENYEPRIDSKNKSYSIKTNNANPILSNNEEEDDELAIETILTKLKNINKVSTKYQNSTNSIIDRENNNEEEEEFIEEKTKKKYNKRDDEIESSENSNEHANSNEYNSDFDKEYSNQNKGDFAKKSANNHTIKQVTYQNKQKLKIFQEEEEEEEETYGKVKNNQTNRKEKEESILDKVKSLINNDYDEIEEEEFDDDYKTSTLNQAKNIIQGDKNEMNILDFEDEEINEDEEAKIQKIIKSYSSINESSSSHEEIIPEEEEEATEIRDQNISSKISTLKIAVENDSSENSVMESKSKQMPAFDIPLLDEIMSNPRKTSHTKKGKKENVDSDSSLDSDEEKIVQSYLSSDDEEAKPPPTSQKHENRQIRKSDKLSHEKESKKKEKPKDSSNKNYSNDENDSDSKDDELVKKILSSSHIIDSSESPPELLSSDSDSDSDSSESYVDKLKKLFPNLDLD